MGSSIGFYCSSKDTESLTQYAESLGLVLAAPEIDKDVPSLVSEGPYCYISVKSKEELSPYGDPPIKISDATDPLIGFMRAYERDNYLVLGHLYLSNDVPELHKQTKPTYNKLCKWVKYNWEKYGDFYIAPDAKLLKEKGAELVNVYPDNT